MSTPVCTAAVKPFQEFNEGKSKTRDRRFKDKTPELPTVGLSCVLSKCEWTDNHTGTGAQPAAA